MTTAIGYDKILGKTADDLFEEYSVEELGLLMTRLSEDVSTKKQKLKLLVGNKYRDLLNVADDIIKMNNITTSENEQLMKLAFKKSDYNSKALSNLSKFNAHLEQVQIEKVQSDNKLVILKNAVHDLNYSLITLKHSLVAELQSSDDTPNPTDLSNGNNLKNTQSIDLDENLDYYRAVSTNISNGFVLIAKNIFLIKYYFTAEIQAHPSLFAVIKYKQLCTEFSALLETNITKLKHEADTDYVLNLFVSKIIASKTNPIDVLQWILDQRSHHFETLVKSKASFQDLLNYAFITVEFVKFIHSRISVTVNRIKSNTGANNWIQQTSFHKWSKWLNKKSYLQSDEEDNQFHYTFEMENERVLKSVFDKIMKEWNIKISQLLLVNFNTRFDKSSDNLTDLVILLRYVLISFKHFTSLSKLPVDNENIVDFIISKWSEEYFKQLTNKLTEFESISELILKTFNDEQLIHTILNSSGESCLFEFKDEFDINALLQFSLEKNYTDQVFVLLDKFKQDLKSTSNSIESLKTLSALVLKPLLTIDDYEDDDFWVEISGKLKDILSKSVGTSVSILNNSISEFFDKVSNLLKTYTPEVSNTRIFYVMRILVQLEEKIQLGDFYETFSKYSNDSIDKRIELSELIEPLLESYFQVIIKSTYNSKYSAKLKELLTQRFDASKEYSEFMLWEQISDDKQLPTICSIEYSELLFSLCSDLLTVDGHNYSNMYVLPSFENVRQTTVNLLLKEIDDFIKDLKQPEEEDIAFDAKTLLTYSDYFFTNFLLDGDTVDDIEVESFTNSYKTLTDVAYRKQIISAISENYKNQSLMYYPLSK